MAAASRGLQETYDAVFGALEDGGNAARACLLSKKEDFSRHALDDLLRRLVGLGPAS